MAQPRWFRRLAALVLSGIIAAGPARAEGWAGFYTSSRPSVSEEAIAIDNDQRCLREIFAAQERYGIPDNLLLAIGLQEAGLRNEGRLTVWPWSVNAAGEGRVFDSREAALAWVHQKQAEGVSSIDTGCMQVNRKWHPDAFDSLAQSFDPAANVDYAARFLVDLHRRTGDWWLAAGSYHSFTPDARETYLNTLKRNLAVAQKRSAYFIQLAGAAVAHEPNTLPQADGRKVPVFWSAAMTEDQDMRLSIYSTNDLQPVLPEFTRTN
ncbi:transglycosylase SLT domain-containing protein [Thioclava atlantica]|uniref:Lytic murein transglycosylase family protein n=1 Tax=Thioclava atlantica TaxID=1317124 RepID=A0A085TY77_9RHOB|nr:transglycosylase SLT domain-containing protein [Thioclava atlantica]KFE35674.1 lytic murein transglycosylase family protein [Thioclava atlantica]